MEREKEIEYVSSTFVGHIIRHEHKKYGQKKSSGLKYQRFSR